MTKLHFNCDTKAFKCRLVMYDEELKLLAKISGYRNPQNTFSFKSCVKPESSQGSYEIKVLQEQVQPVDAAYIASLGKFEVTALLQAVRHAYYSVKPRNWAQKRVMASNIERIRREYEKLAKAQYADLNIDRLPMDAAGQPIIQQMCFKVAKCLNNQGFESRLFKDEHYRFISYTDDNDYWVIEDNKGEHITVSKGRFTALQEFTDL